VSSVGGTETIISTYPLGVEKDIRIVDVDCTKRSQVLPELLDRLGVGYSSAPPLIDRSWHTLDLLITLLALTLLLDVESQVLE